MMEISDARIAKRYLTLYNKCQRDNIPFNLTLGQYKQLFRRKLCPYTGIVLKDSVLHQGDKVPPCHPTVDKIIPERGYIAGNVILASYGGNTMKGNIDLCTAKNVVKVLEKYHEL
jgi:hypothetical protein